MLSAKYVKKKAESNDMKTINSTKSYKNPELDISVSNSSNSTDKNKILKLLNFDKLKKVNLSKINNKITEPKKILFSNSRLRNLQILVNDTSINKLGKSTIDVNKMFGKVNLKKDQEKEEIKKVPNEKFYSFKNEYILKFAQNAEYFNNFWKNIEFIAENKRENFNEVFSKMKRILVNQTNLFFNNNKMNTNKGENSKFEALDLKSGFYKYKSKNKVKLPTIFKTLQNEEINDSSILEKNNIEENNMDEYIKLKSKEIISGFYQLCLLMNKFLSVIFNELKESKEHIKKLNQKLKDYEVRLESNSKEMNSMKSFLSKYEVNSKIFLKIKNEKEIEKIKSIYNKKENEYILSNFRLKSEIKNLTSLLDENQKYFNKCKELEQEINLGKKKNEEIKNFYNQELLEKNMENVIKTENEEELVKKIEGMQIMIEGLKNEKDEYKKKDIENQIKIKNLNMNINEKIENIMMQNEEIEWFIREYNKLNMNYLDTKKDLSNIENLLLTKMKEKEKKKENKKEEETKKTDSKEDEKTEDKEDKNDSENSFLEDMFQMK